MKARIINSAARWIWTRDVVPNSMIAALKKWDLSSAPKRAVLRVFADTKYKLYVNGSLVNVGPVPFRKPVVRVDALDVTEWLREGENTVLILAHFVGTNTKYNIAESPGLIASLDARLSDGRRVCGVTDASWRVADMTCWNRGSPRRNWAIEHVEELDLAHPAFRILARYAHTDYAAGKTRAEPSRLWREPRCFDRPDIEMRDRGLPLLRWRREELTRPAAIFRTNTEIYNLQDTAVRLDHEHACPERDEQVYEMTRAEGVALDRREGEPGFALLYDMRRMCAGEAAAEIVCDAPCTLDLALAEDLRADGRPIVWRNGGLFYARFHLVKGVNRVRFYHFNGHRYLYLVIKDTIGAVEVRRVTTHHCRADLDFSDFLVCEDREAESLYRICRRSLALNTQALTYDCNTREQGAYWGDGLWIADSVGHQTGDFRHLRHYCDAFIEEVRTLGPLISGALFGLGEPLYDYCLVPVELLRRYYRYTGDRETIARALPTARTVVEAFRGFRDSDGWVSVARIPKQGGLFRPGRLFLDHPGNGWHPMTTVGIDRRDPSVGLNCFYLQALQALAELERVLGHRDRAADAAREADQLRQRLRDEAFVPHTGLLADSLPVGKERSRHSQIVNALGVSTGVIEGDAARHALSTVLDIERHPWVSQGTPYSYFFLAEAAARCGLGGVALRAFGRHFRHMLARGATTPWEAWNAENHDSRNHAWSAPLPYLTRRALIGLDPVKPGYAELALSPQLDACDRIECSCRIPQGALSVRWERIAPHSRQVTVALPTGVVASLNVFGTKHRFRRGWRGEVQGA